MAKKNIPTKKKYSTKEQLLFYGKRFLKTFVPTLIVVIAGLGLEPSSFVVAVVAPALVTFEKWMREQGWYKV